MFLLARPESQAIRRFLDSQRNCEFTYPDAGNWSAPASDNYKIDHHRVRLGEGLPHFQQAREAIKRWEMFNIGWLDLCWPDAPIQSGSVVAVLANHLGFWSLNACRIVSVIDDDRTYGFTYGTLPDHAERGQERFSVEWRQDDDSVWYDILAYSQPNQVLSRLGYPIARLLQKQFARDSMLAMRRSTSC